MSFDLDTDRIYTLICYINNCTYVCVVSNFTDQQKCVLSFNHFVLYYSSQLPIFFLSQVIKLLSQSMLFISTMYK